MFIMKKLKLLMASIVVSLSLASAPVVANPGEKLPPQQANAVQQPSFSAWFYSLFDF